jgi:hypothetical protein
MKKKLNFNKLYELNGRKVKLIRIFDETWIEHEFLDEEGYHYFLDISKQDQLKEIK